MLVAEPHPRRALVMVSPDADDVAATGVHRAHDA
jgi:hypothetical protein